MNNTLRNHNLPWTVENTAKMLCLFNFVSPALSIKDVASIMSRTPGAIYARKASWEKFLIKEGRDDIDVAIGKIADKFGTDVSRSYVSSIVSFDLGPDKPAPGMAHGDTDRVRPQTLGDLIKENEESRGYYAICVLAGDGSSPAGLRILQDVTKQEVQKQCVDIYTTKKHNGLCVYKLTRLNLKIETTATIS